MNKRLDGKIIKPKDLTRDRYEGSSIVENIVLASSNLLRKYFGLKKSETIPGPIPKFVTRKNPSLDNYFADLLLRTCYEPVDYLPAYEEHVIRGAQEELPSDLNPRLVDAVLIGIGGMSKNPDFKKVYDEHTEHGERVARSAGQVVFQQHLEPYIVHPGINSILPIIEELNYVDSSGNAFYEHIFTITKNLHIAQFKQPGFVSESLDAQWKRAIIEAALMSVCVKISEFENYENEKAIKSLQNEFDIYLHKIEKLQKGGFIDPVFPEVIEYVKKTITKSAIAEVNGKHSYFTFRKILFALQKVWDPLIVSFIMGFLFESMLQAQQSFVLMQKKEINIREVFGKYFFIYYQKEPLDKLPHRGILYRMNNEKKRVAVAVYDPVRQITAICRNNFLFPKIWKRFYDLLVEKEGDKVWYTPTNEEGKIADFFLNGTESFVGVPMSKLTEDDLYELYKTAIKTSG